MVHLTCTSERKSATVYRVTSCYLRHVLRARNLLSVKEIIRCGISFVSRNVISCGFRWEKAWFLTSLMSFFNPKTPDHVEMIDFYKFIQLIVTVERGITFLGGRKKCMRTSKCERKGPFSAVLAVPIGSQSIFLHWKSLLSFPYLQYVKWWFECLFSRWPGSHSFIHSAHDRITVIRNF